MHAQSFVVIYNNYPLKELLGHFIHLITYITKIVIITISCRNVHHQLENYYGMEMIHSKYESNYTFSRRVQWLTVT